MLGFPFEMPPTGSCVERVFHHRRHFLEDGHLRGSVGPGQQQEAAGGWSLKVVVQPTSSCMLLPDLPNERYLPHVPTPRNSAVPSCHARIEPSETESQTKSFKLLLSGIWSQTLLSSTVHTQLPNSVFCIMSISLPKLHKAGMLPLHDSVGPRLHLRGPHVPVE